MNGPVGVRNRAVRQVSNGEGETAHPSNVMFMLIYRLERLSPTCSSCALEVEATIYSAGVAATAFCSAGSIADKTAERLRAKRNPATIV